MNQVADHPDTAPNRAMTTKRVLFVFDRVAHYHRPLFIALESELAALGLELHLLSGQTSPEATGRVGLTEPVIQNETKYRFFEYPVGNRVLRFHRGVGKVVKNLEPDVLVMQSHVGDVSSWRLAAKRKSRGYRLVAWQCGYEYNPGSIKDFLLARYLGRFDHHLAYHTNAAAYLRKYRVPDDRVTVMHNTIDERQIAVIPKAQAKDALAKRHPETTGRRIVLFVGAVLAEKNIESIVQALQLLQRADLTLLVVGDGEHLQRLRAACRGRTDVVFAGQVVDGVGTYFDASDVYVLPGTGGLGINEAMAHGLPVVAGFADGSADDLVIDGENGHRLRQGTPEEIAAALASVLDDPVKARSMGERSTELIRGTFAFEGFVRRIVDALAATTAGEGPQAAEILHFPLHGTTLQEAAGLVQAWAQSAESRVVLAANVHMVMEARDDAGLLSQLSRADLSVPDGRPLVWALRLLGCHTDHVRGADLMQRVLGLAETSQLPVGLYGSTPEIVATLRRRLLETYPSLQVPFIVSPPFRALSESEDHATVEALRESGARILFVGLGCPKQERWMMAHRGVVPCVMLGVGAAFDFLAGTSRQAPAWSSAAGSNGCSVWPLNPAVYGSDI